MNSGRRPAGGDRDEPRYSQAEVEHATAVMLMFCVAAFLLGLIIGGLLF